MEVVTDGAAQNHLKLKPSSENLIAGNLADDAAIRFVVEVADVVDDLRARNRSRGLARERSRDIARVQTGRGGLDLPLARARAVVVPTAGNQVIGLWTVRMRVRFLATGGTPAEGLNFLWACHPVVRTLEWPPKDSFE